jgi:hypothetical protein
MKSLLILLSFVASLSASAAGPFIKSFPIKINNYSDKNVDLSLKISLICVKKKTANINGFFGGSGTYDKDCGTKDVILDIKDKNIVNTPAFEKLHSSSLKNYWVSVRLVKKLKDGSIINLSEKQVLDGNETQPYNQNQFTNLTKINSGLEYSIYSSPISIVNSQARGHFMKWAVSPTDTYSTGIGSLNIETEGQKFNTSYLMVSGNPGANPKIQITLAEYLPVWTPFYEETIDYVDFSLVLDQANN